MILILVEVVLLLVGIASINDPPTPSYTPLRVYCGTAPFLSTYSSIEC